VLPTLAMAEAAEQAARTGPRLAGHARTARRGTGAAAAAGGPVRPARRRPAGPAAGPPSRAERRRADLVQRLHTAVPVRSDLGPPPTITLRRVTTPDGQEHFAADGHDGHLPANGNGHANGHGGQDAAARLRAALEDRRARLALPPSRNGHSNGNGAS
jgi:hypothetical protein